MASKAVQRRFDALNVLVSVFLNEGNAYQTEGTTEDRERYATMVRDMVKLGRTERWQANCEGAALSALDESNDFGWVVRQWSVYMGYAAE